MPRRRKRLHNEDVSRALREMSLFLEMDGVPFKPQAYEKAAYAVAALDRPIAAVYEEGGAKALAELPGIGKGIAERIAKMIETGTMEDLEALRAKTPIDVLELTALDGVGPKTARALHEALGVRTLRELERAAAAGKIHGLPHFGERSEQKLLAALRFHAEAGGRRPLGTVLPIALRIESALRRVEGVVEAAVAGSIRRRRDMVGDVDVLVAARDAGAVSRAFARLPEVGGVLAAGPTKTTVRLANGMDADLRVVDESSWGAALMYFTGSKSHNVALRKIAQQRELKLNEYGLFAGAKRVASRTEEEIYEALDLPWIAPEIREDAGELDRAHEGALPSLIERGELRGDLQVHTSWTDGSRSIEEMARAAKALGLEYIAITDHTRDLAMTGGLGEDELAEQLREVRAVDRKLRGFRVLAGAEVNIRPDGSLDVDGAALAKLDLVGAAIHSHFELDRAAMTRRVIRAIEDPHVDILFHPTSRALGHRPAISLDFEAVLAAALRTGTVLELDAQPARLDLPDTMLRRAVEAGALVAVDSDAHTEDELRFVDTFGYAAARRGWVETKSVINALTVERMLARLKRARHARRRRAS